MKFKFDPNQQYQLDAISSVVDLFSGAEKSNTSSGFLPQTNTKTLLTLDYFKNHLSLSEETIKANLEKIQERNNMFSQRKFSDAGRNFSVEMETGTGKTYVYLRTVFELNKQYGFSKFIIVVPSVAIREGVLKSMNLMESHFKKLYDNPPYDFFVYNSKQLSDLRSFSQNAILEIMIINIDSFNKKANIMNQHREDGRYIDFISRTNPIVILDEPQNMEGDKHKQAIASLAPVFTLRYSATHREVYNLVYRLDPVQAFQKKLVKRISVHSVVKEDDPTRSYIEVLSISNRNNRFTCKLKYFKLSSHGGHTKATGILKKDDDLYEKSKGNNIYKNGFIVTEINAAPGQEFIKFSNGNRLALGERQGGFREEIIKKQIEDTIVSHFDKELQLKGQGIKVLSLFFLDKVRNYREYGNNGYQLGSYARYFEEIYEKVSRRKEYEKLNILPVSKVHDGYFSVDRKKKMKDTRGNTKADNDTYSLIMKDKEKLLDINNPLKFIFSHSALKEGWDNPNVFQICTLNETTSAIKKRQEIGRGMRLPVNQAGDRIENENISDLVVVANENYDEFASSLQTELEKEVGITFGKLPVEAFAGICYAKGGKQTKVSVPTSKKIWDYLRKKKMLAEDGSILDKFDEAIEKNTFSVPITFRIIKQKIIETIESYKKENYIRRHKPQKVSLNKETFLDPEFKKFWNKISGKTVYSVSFDTKKLIKQAGKAIKKMTEIEPLQITTTSIALDITKRGVGTRFTKTQVSESITREKNLPDILSYIQDQLQLTRRTIFEILKKSGRLEDALINPQQFMDLVIKEIKVVLNKFIINGIKYERLNAVSYEMSRFEEEAQKLEFINSKIVPTKKSIYDYICYDSKIEKKFAEDLENIDDIKYFIKLPNWFRVPTPVGDYNPDWAILKKNGDIVYMIRETKSTLNISKLRPDEPHKVTCGRRHFESIDVDYRVCTSVKDAKL